MQGCLGTAAEYKWWQLINQLLFANDRALVAVSEKLYRLMSEFGRVSERRKLRVNISKSTVIIIIFFFFASDR